MRAPQAAEIQDPEQSINRRLRDLRAVAAGLKGSRMTPLQTCEAIIDNRLIDARATRFFSGLPEDEKHYWISSLYACLIPEKRRRRLAAYFTPPHLAQYCINKLVATGIQPGKDRILDPASGGAAFLVPLAEYIAAEGRRRRTNAATILSRIENTLAGIEIEQHLAALSRKLLAETLLREISSARRKLKIQIRHADALKSGVPELLYDAVIGNPPYGRVFRPSRSVLKGFSQVITGGYVNLYALFIKQALQWVRPGGIVCLIVPLSFVGGANFAALRQHILENATVISLDPIDKRNDVFLDVLYDVCVLTLRKKDGKKCTALATSSLLLINEPPRKLGRLDIPPIACDRIWALPDGRHEDRLFQSGLQTLEDYGYTSKTGYFVWNREQHRYRVGYKPRTTEVPLFWAHNVKANASCLPHDGKSDPSRIGLAKVAKDSTAIVQTDAIILQRTTNRRQKRRLVAALILQDSVPGSRGFVSENHTILIVPDPAKSQRLSLKMLCRLLNTAAVDARFRRISGTVNVSTKALRVLPLPVPEEVVAAFAVHTCDDEAAEAAYEQSLCKVGTAARPKASTGGARGG